MARSLRVAYPDAVYHVMSRGNNRESVMMDDEDRGRYLEVLQESVEIYGVILYAYVLMGNHVHLLIKTPQANISDFMRRLHLTYTSYFNWKYKRCGHLFQGRFKSHLVQEERYLQALSQYIHLNPVRIPSMETRSVSEKIAHLRAYSWSSLPGYRVRNQQLSFLRYDLLLEPYGGNTTTGRRKYWNALRAFVRKGAETTFPAEVFGGFVLGSIDFAREILKRIRHEGGITEAPLRSLRSQVTQEHLWKRLKTLTGKSQDEVIADKGIERDLIMECLCRHAGMKATEVARVFGLNATAVSKYRKRARKSITEDEASRKFFETLTQ